EWRRNGVALGLGCEMVEKAARPRRIVAAEYFGALHDQPPKRAQHLRAAFESDKRVVFRDLKAIPQRRAIELHQNVRIDAQLVHGVAAAGRKITTRKHVDAGQRQSFRARKTASCDRIAVAPLRTGAGIEQDADDGEIEVRARPRQWILEVFG